MVLVRRGSGSDHLPRVESPRRRAVLSPMIPMHEETHLHRSPPHDDWMTGPISRRAVLVAGATAAGVALAGCGSFGGGSTPDPAPIDNGDGDTPESETTQVRSTRTGSIQFVGSAPEQHDTIQSAVDAAAPGGRVSVTLSYDSSLESWPVVSETVVTVEADGLLPEIEIPNGPTGSSSTRTTNARRGRSSGASRSRVALAGSRSGERSSRNCTTATPRIARTSPTRSRTPSRPTARRAGPERTPSNSTAARRTEPVKRG